MKAFPHNEFKINSLTVSAEEGMNLRDYFAAKAMIALIPLLAEDGSIDHPDDRRDKVASLAYKQADFMMMVRNR